MKKLLIIPLYFSIILSSWSQAIVDLDVLNAFKHSQPHMYQSHPQNISLLVFMNNETDITKFNKDFESISNVSITKFDGLPMVIVTIPKNIDQLHFIMNHPSIKQISSYQGSKEEMEISEQAILLKSSTKYPDVNNWWAHNYTGANGVVGIIDTGIDFTHESLKNKELIIRKEINSGYDDFVNGVRTAHATGIACIYAGNGSGSFLNDSGVSFGTQKIVTGLAGEENAEYLDKYLQTLSTLDWMLKRAAIKPDVINYSFGNGNVACEECTDWSGFAKIVDYTVNHYKILWVKSAGNGGFIAPKSTKPFASTMTIPADNYNALTVANMNPVIKINDHTFLNPDRRDHTIRYTSSRGPTLMGRKKPDISVPGHDTRTCAPDPAVYPTITYTKAMDYQEGYRLMGGTSSAAPHAGSAALLLKSAGINSPMAIKALLINSADSYTDSNKTGPDDPKNVYEGGHFPVMGSTWSRTYGWGYLNLQKAFDEKENIIESSLSLENPEKVFEINIPVGGKVTLVHERRVGYSENKEWALTPLSLEIVDAETLKPLMIDNSRIDSVHQVDNCRRKSGERHCLKSSKPIRALIKVKLMNRIIEGDTKEDFAIVFSGSKTQS